MALRRASDAARLELPLLAAPAAMRLAAREVESEAEAAVNPADGAAAERAEDVARAPTGATLAAFLVIDWPRVRLALAL